MDIAESLDLGPGLFPVREHESLQQQCSCLDCHSGACCCHYRNELSCGYDADSFVIRSPSQQACGSKQQVAAERLYTLEQAVWSATQRENSQGVAQAIPDRQYPQACCLRRAVRQRSGDDSCRAFQDAREPQNDSARQAFPGGVPSTKQPTAKKYCKPCDRFLPHTSFCASRRASDGLNSQCRSCVAEKDRERREVFKRQPKSPVANKVCACCRERKPASDFYLDVARPDGLQTYCRPCFAQTYKDKRAKS